MKDPRNDERNLQVGRDEYHRLIELLALEVHASRWTFDQIRSSVPWYKACSAVAPDCYVRHLPTHPWIHQPFGAWETVRPHKPGEWLRRGTGQQGAVDV